MDTQLTDTPELRSEYRRLQTLSCQMGHLTVQAFNQLVTYELKWGSFDQTPRTWVKGATAVYERLLERHLTPPPSYEDTLPDTLEEGELGYM